MEEDPMDLGAVATVQCNTMLTAPALALLATSGAILLGQKDLVSEADGFMEPAEFEAMTANDWDHLRPVLTIDFVKSQIKMGPEVPMEVANGVCLDIIEFADCYSWHEFDLGRIEDVKHVIEPIDDNSVVAPSRPALYTPRNDAIIHAKCDPLVEMGVYTLAGPDSYNRSQLVIAKRPIPPEVSRKRDTDLPQDIITEDELKYYRVAHDLRGLNAKCRLRPWPMTTLSEMSLWIANRSVFFSVDADRGFQQIVNDPGSVKFTSFEMFHQLFVSLRMQFGDLNAPGTFAQNCDAMLGDLKFKDKKVKNYFDDIIGGASQMDFWGLRQTKRALLERCRDHGWKLKPRKEQFGFTDMEMIGLVFSKGFTSIPQRRVDVLQNLQYPKTATLLKSFLGLANTFRDRVPGFALRVSSLTALTRMKGKISLSPEAIMEFDAIKAYLKSPAVLMQFVHGRRTFVYTDASVGSHNQSMTGGLGVVITQMNPENNQEYVCAYASAGLSTAQVNYHIARLEALAFVWSCGRFNEWLSAQPFTWRTDARANKFIQDTKFSHNPALCRYSLVLQAYKYEVEWIPGIRLIADALSRLVLTSVKTECITLPELVFGKDLGPAIYAEKHAPNPGSSVSLASVPILTGVSRSPFSQQMDRASRLPI
jgi:hypothetical protein